MTLKYSRLSRPSDAAPEPEEPVVQASSSKRKGGKNKKLTEGQLFATAFSIKPLIIDADPPPSTPQGGSRRTKKNNGSNKKAGKTTAKEPEEAPKPASSKGSGKKGNWELSNEERALDDLDDDDEDDDMAEEDRSIPFRSDFLGSGASSLSHSARALIGGMMPHAGVGHQLRVILENLRQHEDPSVQRAALEELAGLLLMANEDSLNGQFSPDSFVKELVIIMQGEGIIGPNPEMMLLACRCIANLIEALPQAAHSVVTGGAVPVLCQKLIEIDYIDLAEQALIVSAVLKLFLNNADYFAQTLEKVSDDYPGSIVRAGGLTACLTFLDFFATPTQRTAVTAAAKCCRDLSETSFPMIKEVMPILLNVLGQSDQKVVEQGSLCITRIVSSFEGHPKLDELVSPLLLQAILRLLLPGSTNLIGLDIHTQFLRLLAIVARSSPTLSAELFKMNVVDTLYQILTGVSPPEDTDDMGTKIDGVIVMQALIHRPREQIFETLNIICELLPEVAKHSVARDDKPPQSPPADDSAQEIKKSLSINATRLELLEGCRDKVKRFVMILLPTLTYAYSSTVNLSVRQKVLTAQLKMLSNIDPSILESALRAVPFASFLASILSQQDHPDLVHKALLAVELLLLRLKALYAYQFCREGVMAEISKLADKTLTERKRSLVEPTIKDIGDNDMPLASNPARQGNESESEDEIMEVEERDDDEDDDEDHHNDLQDEMSPSPSTSSDDDDPLEHLADTSEELVVKKAKKILESFQDAQSLELRGKAEGILSEMSSLARELCAYYANGHMGGAGDGKALFRSIATYFNADALDSITSAELLSSGIVDTLLDIFGTAWSSSDFEARSAFLETFLGAMPQRNAAVSPFSILVHKLQDLLSRAEHFEVVTVHNNSQEVSRSSSSSQLSKQLRLKLVADEDSDIPERWRTVVVSIHAITSFRSLDDYLRPRMTLHEHSRAGRREVISTLAALAAAPGGPHHHRFMERSLLGLHEPMTPPPPPPPPTTAPKQPSHEPSQEKGSNSSNVTGPQNAPNEAKPSKRQARRQKSSNKAPTPPAQPSQESKETLECIDERQIDDEENEDDRSGLDAFVEDLEDELEDGPMPDPGAVNLEVASTGKVTARQEDGTRIPTPSQNPGTPSALAPPPPRPSSGMASPLLASRGMSYAAAAQAIPQDWHLEFSIDGRPIVPEMTVYRAVHSNQANPGNVISRSVWNMTHPVKFKKVSGPPPTASLMPSTSLSTPSSDTQDLPDSLHNNPTTSKILRLLDILHDLNDNLETIFQDRRDKQFPILAEAASQFVNTKLTAKLNRQLEEPLVVASDCLPTWSKDLPRHYPFLFPFETRYLFLQSTSFGNQRSIERWMSTQNEDSRRDRRRDERPYLPTPKKQKVRISRSRILDSALKVLELYGHSSAILEVEYFEEVGTGLGPTLEFYSNVSKEFSRKKYRLWRENETNPRDEYAFGKLGLFPAPMTKQESTTESSMKILNHFKMLGKFVARSMLDSRMIDISFNPLFFKKRDVSVDPLRPLAAITAVDSGLASSLKLIRQFVQAKKRIEKKRVSQLKKSQELQQVICGDVSIDQLGLDFTLPGYAAIELIDNGSNIAVTMENVELYLEKVIDLTIGSGVDRQIQEFQNGFSLVLPYAALKTFTPAELVMLFGRSEEDWSLESKCRVPE